MKTYEERYFYPGTQTLINNYDIKDPDKLKAVEARMTAGVFVNPPAFDYRTVDGLKSAHSKVFGKLYPWAGEFRAETVIKKEDGKREDVRFLDGSRVATSMTGFCGALNDDLENGRFFGLDNKTFAYRASVYLADFNHIHPFPDGNGRVQRLFLSGLAQDSGYAIDQTKFTRESWIDAAVSSREQSLYDRRGQLTGLNEGAKMPELVSDALSPLKKNDRPDRIQHLVDRYHETAGKTGGPVDHSKDEDRER
ncbi:MAG: Fic family protein [Pseudomonadota bacterium]